MVYIHFLSVNIMIIDIWGLVLCFPPHDVTRHPVAAIRFEARWLLLIKRNFLKNWNMEEN